MTAGVNEPGDGTKSVDDSDIIRAVQQRNGRGKCAAIVKRNEDVADGRDEHGKSPMRTNFFYGYAVNRII